MKSICNRIRSALSKIMTQEHYNELKGLNQQKTLAPYSRTVYNDDRRRALIHNCDHMLPDGTTAKAKALVKSTLKDQKAKYEYCTLCLRTFRMDN